MSPLKTWLSVVLALVVAASLNTGRILLIAERLPVGESRDRWVELATDLDNAASTIGLDRPSDWVDQDGQSGAPTIPSGGPSSIALTSTTALKSTPTSASPAPTTSTVPTTTTTPETSTAPETTTAPEPTATTEHTVPPLPPVPDRRATRDNPLVIWAGGDSLGEFIGQELAADYARTDSIRTVLDYRIATGLTRPDYFDWTLRIAEAIETENPDIMIFMVGGNDDQPMALGDGYVKLGSPEWGAEYQARAEVIMNMAAAAEIHLVWILLPPVVDERRSEIHSVINQALVDAAASRPLVTIYDPTHLLVSPDGSVERYVVGPDGDRQRARAGDGLHVTRRGSRWIAEEIWDVLLTTWADSLPES